MPLVSVVYFKVHFFFFLKKLMKAQIKDSSVSELRGILGSAPVPHILSTEIFSVWTIELELRPILCLDKKEKAAGLHIHTIESLNSCNTLDRVGAVFITEVMCLRFPSTRPDYENYEPQSICRESDFFVLK